MTFPTRPRYPRVMRHVQHFLDAESISEFPIDPFSIIKRNNWKLVRYSSLSKKSNVPMNEIMEAFGGDGYTIFNAKGYKIAYNDTVTSSERIRFTLMHEIGHIVLGHFADFDETVLARSNLSDTKYEILEKEANCFARNVLAPAIIVSALKVQSVHDLVDIFQISYDAAKVRLSVLHWDIKAPLIGVLTRSKRFIDSVRNTRFCLNCSHTFLSQKAVYCPICGHDELIDRKWGGPMFYPGYELDNEGRPSKCPRCENENLRDGEYCGVCKTQIVNRCTNSDSYYGSPMCGVPAGGQDRFCIYCGHPTTYLNQGLLKSWEQIKREQEEQEEIQLLDRIFS